MNDVARRPAPWIGKPERADAEYDTKNERRRSFKAARWVYIRREMVVESKAYEGGWMKED